MNSSDSIEAVYRSESRRVLATLIRLLGDFDLAEEALHEAFAAALRQWPSDMPANPRSWLVSTGRFKAIDTLRRRKRLNEALPELARDLAGNQDRETEAGPGAVVDDQLRLIFLCCHPVNPVDSQVALTLREVCGLQTEDIADAYLIEVAAVAKRIVRAKDRIRKARIPYEIPARADLPHRLEAVLRVIYLVFHEGYSASAGPSLVRASLSAEAIRLGQLLYELLPEPEAAGLLALMLLQESRQAARVANGDLVLLEDQDRRLWNPDLIREGLTLVDKALAFPRPGPYALQAAIAALHAESATFAATDWPQIVALYDLLLRTAPSPVVELNRAVAVGMRDGPGAALTLVDGILAQGTLADYHLIHAVRADLLRRLNLTGEARAAYTRAVALARQEPERRFLQKRLMELER